MRYSMLSALCVMVVLAPLCFAAARRRAHDTITYGLWLLSIAAGAVPESWWVEQEVMSLYTVVAAAAAILGVGLVGVGLRRGDPRPSFPLLAAFTVAACVAHAGVTVIFRATS